MANNTVLIGIPCLMTGGTEVQTLRLVEILVEGGYRVVVACYFEHTAEMVARYLRAGAAVERLSPDGSRQQGVWGQCKFLYRGLRQVVKQYRPRVAHVQYMAPGALPILVLRLLGVKDILATSHTMGDIYRSTRLVRLLQRRLLRAFTCITLTAEESFFGSSQLYSEALPLKCHNHFTIYNCLSKDSKITNISKDSKCSIGFVGRLERIKGADLLLPAFAELRKTLPSATLTIVGDGSLKELMTHQQRELGLEVRWMGRQPQEALADIYGGINILWMPSRSEGFGLTAIEAMAEGCLVVASRTGGLPEILQQEALLCEKENPVSLAQTTLSLIENPPAIDPAQRASQFTFERYRAQILSLYSSLIAHNSKLITHHSL